MGAYFDALGGPFLDHHLTANSDLTRQWAQEAILPAGEARVLLSGQIGDVTANAVLDATLDVNLNGQIGDVVVTASFDAVVTVEVVGQIDPVTLVGIVEAAPDTVAVNLVGQIDPVTAEVEIATDAITVALDGQVGPVTAVGSIEAEEVPLTDTGNRVSGRQRTGYGVATWFPAVVPTPPPLSGGGR